MPYDQEFTLRHLPLPPLADSDRGFPFRPVGTRHTGSRFPDRPDARLHGQRLRRQVETVIAQFKEENPGLDQWTQELAAFGIIVEIGGAPGYALASGDLEDRTAGFRLLRERLEVDENGSSTVVAVVFVPYGKVDRFFAKIDDYIAAEPDEGELRPRQDLISGMNSVRLATVRGLWSDGIDSFPPPGESAWWEAWVRRSDSGVDHPDDPLFRQFRDACGSQGIECSREVLALREQFVVLIKATVEQISGSTPLISTLQELRRPKDHAGFFMRETRRDQQGWIDGLVDRISAWPALDAPAVCLLDTGVNRAHPLLEEILTADNCDAYERERFGVTDQDGHGTQMAGLAAYGDLTPLLPGTDTVQVSHRLESVKMIPTSGTTYGKIHYGYITRECIDRPETWLHAATRPRVYCLTVCSSEDLDRGRPSAWSAALDGAILNNAVDDSGSPRLVCVAAGNIARSQVRHYPRINDQSSCHDPAQAWNAITVGAYTEKDVDFADEFRGWRPVASPGDLCPSATTGVEWNKHWPVKPDIVMEGGNYASHPHDEDSPDTPDALQLLTTHHRPHERLFAATGDTSAAAAQAARMCARILAANPGRWPETIRALLVHSARWTPQMTGWKDPVVKPSTLTKLNALRMVQRFGFGVPDLSRALHSARSAVTLIAEEVIQPFTSENDGERLSYGKTKGYNRHRIPEPVEQLERYGERNARMRVTLSYFVDPNPTNPAVTSKFRYQGAGLRFEVKSKNDGDDDFFARINGLEREPSEDRRKSDSGDWLLGYDHRSRGSLHSDIWYGSAADLARKDCIAVFPVGGWWKLRPFLGRVESRLRYSLVVSVEVDGGDIDIYTPIASSLAVTIAT